jgi:DNA polymerase I
VQRGKGDRAIKLSCDESVLSQIDHPVAGMVLDLRGMDKLRGTYIVPLLQGGKHICDDGLVHTTYNHLLTGTGRLSSEDPNLQNVPIRSAEGRRIRQAFVASKGHWFVATDYGQIEARVIAMASRCPVLLSALWEGYDIHGDWAERLAHAYPSRVGGKRKLADKAVMKTFRNDVKNQWTFPLFFGSAMESVSAGLSIPTKVIAPLYDQFWESFEAVHTWQDTVKRFYRKHGYVESLTGRRRHGPLSFNEQVNTPIQGTASDIVVDAGNRLSRRAYIEERPQLQFRLNVHDDLSFYIPEATLDDDIHDIAKEMVALSYSFIELAPLVVEVKVGRSWGTLEEVGTVSSVEFGHTRKGRT